MAIDFPNTPTVGQQYAGGGSTWQWDGVAWNIVPQMTPAVASDTPPANPAIGQGWWRGTNGKYYLWLDDGNSKQWVEVAGGPPVKADPYPFITADMSLVSAGLGNINVNNKADGSGAGGTVWSGLNTPYSLSGNGYHKFPNGIIWQWGSVVNSASDYGGTFPLAWPNQALMMVSSVPADMQVPATTIYVSTVQAKTKTGFDVRTRLQSGATTTNSNNLTVCWIAVGF